MLLEQTPSPDRHFSVRMAVIECSQLGLILLLRLLVLLSVLVLLVRTH